MIGRRIFQSPRGALCLKAALCPRAAPLSTATTSNTELKLYGHYVSQPARSVAWLLQLNNQAFEFIRVDVLKGQTRTESFKAKFPTAMIPGLDDGGFCLAEASAIMQYLCEKYDWNQWWPTGSDVASRQKRAKIAEYLSAHHHTTRMITLKVVALRFTGKAISDETKKENVEYVGKILNKFSDTFLRSDLFVNDMPEPTIADLAAYGDIGQLIHFNIFPNFDEFPKVKNWAGKMALLPHYEDVHRSNKQLSKVMKG